MRKSKIFLIISIICSLIGIGSFFINPINHTYMGTIFWITESLLYFIALPFAIMGLITNFVSLFYARKNNEILYPQILVFGLYFLFMLALILLPALDIGSFEINKISKLPSPVT